MTSLTGDDIRLVASSIKKHTGTVKTWALGRLEALDKKLDGLARGTATEIAGLTQKVEGVQEALSSLPAPEKGDAGVGIEGVEDGEGEFTLKLTDGQSQTIQKLAGKPGISPDPLPGADWWFFTGKPDNKKGRDGEGALSAQTKCFYVKDKGKWEEFFCIPQGGDGGLQFMAPRAYSDTKIENIVNRLIGLPNVRRVAVNATVTGDDDVILAAGEITVTLPDASTVEDGRFYRIKNIGDDPVTVNAVSGLIDGETDQVLNVKYYAITAMADNGEWVLV